MRMPLSQRSAALYFKLLQHPWPVLFASGAGSDNPSCPEQPNFACRSVFFGIACVTSTRGTQPGRSLLRQSHTPAAAEICRGSDVARPPQACTLCTFAARQTDGWSVPRPLAWPDRRPCGAARGSTALQSAPKPHRNCNEMAGRSRKRGHSQETAEGGKASSQPTTPNSATN